MNGRHVQPTLAVVHVAWVSCRTLMVVAVAVPLARTLMVPPEKTMLSTADPKAEMTFCPPPMTEVVEAMPPELTYCTPPDSRVAFEVTPSAMIITSAPSLTTVSKATLTPSPASQPTTITPPFRTSALKSCPPREP